MTDFLLKALIVDDEPDAIEILRGLLKDSGKVSVIETVTNPLQAECTIQKYQPDVLFLDIRMPKYDGISLLSNIRKYNHHLNVVYVSAYDSFINEAIKLNVFSYLLKPVDRIELNNLLERIHEKVFRNQEDIQPTKIKLPFKDGFVFLQSEDIFLLEADGNYTKIFTTDGNIYTSSYNMGRISRWIGCNNFLRINRKQFLNSLYLLRVNKKNLLCTAKINGSEFEYNVSRSFLKSFNKGVH